MWYLRTPGWEQSLPVWCRCCKWRREISITEHTCNTCATGLSGSTAELFSFFFSLSLSIYLFLPLSLSLYFSLMETRGREQINKNFHRNQTRWRRTRPFVKGQRRRWAAAGFRLTGDGRPSMRPHSRNDDCLLLEEHYISASHQGLAVLPACGHFTVLLLGSRAVLAPPLCLFISHRRGKKKKRKEKKCRQI